MAAAFIRGTAGLTSHAGNVFQMNDGLNKCNHAVETARALLKYLNNNTTKPESHSCMKICKPIDVTDLSAIQGRLELSGAKITNTWTTVDVDTDKGICIKLGRRNSTYLVNSLISLTSNEVVLLRREHKKHTPSLIRDILSLFRPHEM